tara:strand:- start:151 stop:477 length:327 start_codon:yes stop_codon:yes gene_type:complete
MNSQITLSHSKLKRTSCDVLLQCLSQYPNIPTISCQEALRINNNKIQHQCILQFNQHQDVKTIWEKLQIHIPYIKDAELSIKDKYNGPIRDYMPCKYPLSDIPPYFFT